MVQVRVHLEQKKCLRRNSRLLTISRKTVYPIQIACLALLVLLIVVTLRIGKQHQANRTVQARQTGEVLLSYANACRKLLPANCSAKCILGKTDFTTFRCTRRYGYFVERQHYFRGRPTFCHSPEKVANLTNLVKSVRVFKQFDEAVGTQVAEQLLRSDLVGEIVCLLKRSVWISANLQTVYRRLGGEGCASVARQLLDGLEFLISALPKQDKYGPPDGHAVAAVRFLVGSIPIAAECSRLIAQDRIDQFIAELRILKTMEDFEIYHLPPQTDSSFQQR